MYLFIVASCNPSPPPLPTLLGEVEEEEGDGRCEEAAAAAVYLTGPNKFKTVISDADSKIPKIDRIKLVCQNPGVSQCAVESVGQEKAPMTAAARTVHCVHY